MSNYVLVCHGGIREFSSVELQDGQEVQYRGNFGAPLGYGTALAIWNAIRSDPTVSDRQLARGIANYQPQDVLRGPGTFSPNLDLGVTTTSSSLLSTSTRAATHVLERIG